MAVYGYVGLCMAVYGYVWPCMAMYGCVWLCRAMYGCVGLCMAVYGCVGPCMAVYGCVWLWMSVYSYVCPYRPDRINYSGHFMGHTWTTYPQSPLILLCFGDQHLIIGDHFASHGRQKAT